MGELSKAEAAPGPSKPTGSCDGAWHCSPARKENRSQSRGWTAGPPSSDFPGWDLPPTTQTLPGRGNPSQPSSRKICSAFPSSQQQELTAPCPKRSWRGAPLPCEAAACGWLEPLPKSAALDPPESPHPRTSLPTRSESLQLECFLPFHTLVGARGAFQHQFTPLTRPALR